MFDINNKKESSNTTRVIAITGGKGGVGKTSIAVNLAIALSRNGSNVCLFDADTALGNINIMLGIHPAYTLEHWLSGEKEVRDILIEGPESIQIVPGASGAAQCAELDLQQQHRLVRGLSELESRYDYMLVDTAAGISPTVLHFVAASQVAAVVITPEPTSLTDAFSLIKVLRRRGYRRKVQVVVNMAPSSIQAEKVYRRFSSAVAKYLDLTTEYLGSVWMDESMRTAVTLQKPVALFPKNDPSARSFYRLAERVESVFSRPGTPKLAFSAYWQKIVEKQLEKAKAVTEPQERKRDHIIGSQNKSNDNGAVTNVSVPQVVNAQTPVHKAPIKVVALKSESVDEVIKVEEAGLNSPDTLIDSDNAVKGSQVVEGSFQNTNSGYEDKILELAEKFNQSNSDEMASFIESIDQELNSKTGADLPPSKIEKQEGERRKRLELAEQLASLSATTNEDVNDSKQDSLLDENAEKDWMDLRIRMNRFFNNANTTPEQATTLLSSCIYSFSDRLGDAAVDLLHGLMSALKPEDLSAEQKLLLKNDYERLALNDGKPMKDSLEVPSLSNHVKQSEASLSKQGNVNTSLVEGQESSVDNYMETPQEITKKVSYDAKGFGCQESLAEQIRTNNEQPLESFLESIKHASLASSSGDDAS